MSIIERHRLSADDEPPIGLSILAQLNILICRAKWILKPHPTDEGSASVDCCGDGWMGAAKAFFWMAAAIGLGLLIAGLSD